MYQVDELDEVVELSNFPQGSVGAPLPVLLATEHETHLLFYTEEPEDGVAAITFERCKATMFGPPNDEAFSGHPLADRGLERYSAHEIKNSSWVRGLKRMNSVHPKHSPELFDAYRHFIFTFHDSAFECVACGFSINLTRGSLRAVACQLADNLGRN